MKLFLRSKFTFFILPLLVFGGMLPAVNASAQETIKTEIVNNQSFPVRMPFALKKANLKNENWRTKDGRAAQASGDELVFVAAVPASAALKLNFQNGAAETANNIFQLGATEDASGVVLRFAGAELGRLSWMIIYRNSKPEELKGEPFSTKADFSQNFAPLQMNFRKISSGRVFDVWRGAAEKDGLRLAITLRVFHEGFLDLESRLENVGATRTTDVYAAVLTRWQQTGTHARSVGYDNRISDLKENDWTNFRTGESRNWYVQHGVDWLKTSFSEKISAAWMNDFSQSFTVYQKPTAKRKTGRYVGANIPQIGFEAQTKGADIFILTEIARSNLKSYAERLEDNRLMEPGDGVTFRSHVAFYDDAPADELIDQNFVAYASYAAQKKSANDLIRYEIGVPFVRFGTNYFPFSTLGENFDRLKMPGMDRDGYWPLAADTVNRWPLFADDIRRDLRIAKTLGFELIRLHHLELVYDEQITKEKRNEYLDFFFAELRRLKLKALLDARISAADTAELVRRYRAQIDGVEIDNEVLIFGINEDAPDYWKRVYKAVKEVAPEIPVHLTAHTNTGAFDRLQTLNVPFDKIGQHAYSDGLDSQANMRGFALAAAAYGRRAGKESIITEWNWRFLTRLTPEERARIYAPIFENVLKTRSVPVMYQFQFNESLAMNPRVLKGIRHYEQIWLSRRPKPEAFVLSDLITKYGAPDHANKLIDIKHETIELDQTGRGTANFSVTNKTDKELTLNFSLETPVNLKAALLSAAPVRLKPNETKKIAAALEAAPTDDLGVLPGFYHVFLRVETERGDILRYGWAEAHLAREPKFDRAAKTETIYAADALNFELNRSLAVVYGTGAPIQDVETAYAVVNALESATGRIVPVYEQKDVPQNERAGLILVGTAATNPLIAERINQIPAEIKAARQFAARVRNDLILSGADNLEAERAAMDWTLRFWQYAKDSGARRVGLVEKELPLGVDPAQLP